MSKEIKSVHVTMHCNDNKVLSVEDSTVYRAVDALKSFHDKVKMLHVSITYKNGEKKKANFDAKSKAISWLNLNDTKE